MIDAQYAILKYLPDPSRNEPINVGVVVWVEDQYEVIVAHEAVGRVLAANPRLDRILLETFTQSIEHVLETSWSEFRDNAQKGRTAQFPMPLLSTGAIYTSLDILSPSKSELSQALLGEANWLVNELVRRTQRRSARRGSQPAKLIERQLSLWIESGQVHLRHQVRGARSSEVRELPFFANSGVNIGLDIINLRSDAGEMQIQKSADALAYQLDDVMLSEGVSGIVVYLPTDIKPELELAAPSFLARTDDVGAKLELTAANSRSRFLEMANLDDLVGLGQSLVAD